MKYIGRSLKRIEDRPLLLGTGTFAADCNWPGQVHMRVVRSPVAFGKILGVDTTEAIRVEGVVAVWTIQDVDDLPPIDFRQMRAEGLVPYRQWILARDYVRYVGEPVAVVFAKRFGAADSAAEVGSCPPGRSCRPPSRSCC